MIKLDGLKEKDLNAMKWIACQAHQEHLAQSDTQFVNLMCY
jgi:hypothetical protein